MGGEPYTSPGMGFCWFYKEKYIQVNGLRCGRWLTTHVAMQTKSWQVAAELRKSSRYRLWLMPQDNSLDPWTVASGSTLDRQRCSAGGRPFGADRFVTPKT